MMKEIKTNPMYRYLLVLTVCSMGGLQAWRTLFNNFAVEVVGLDGNHIGVIQSVREVPGFLALLVIFVLMIIKEHKISALSILVLGIGIGATGLFPTYGGVVLTTLVMSFGFHYYETTNQSLTLQHFDFQTSPVVLARLRSMAAASSVVVGILIYFVQPFLSYTQLYIFSGVFIAAAAIWSLFQNPIDPNKKIVPQRKGMVLRKKYWLFYFLTFMAGARRQIFIAFAVFLMVKRFNFSVQEIAILFVLNNIINYFANPLIGKGILRFGERKVLTAEYFSLIFIFLAYALVQTKLLVALLYILDHLLFNFSIAIKTFFQKIGDPEDIAPSMSVGFTINHIAAVILPVIGGILWVIDYRIPFIVGALLSLISLAAVQKIRTGINAK